jgi:hypothetical protein
LTAILYSQADKLVLSLYISKEILLFIGIIINYIIGCFLIRYVTIDDKYISIYYPLRVFNRKIILNFNKIKELKVSRVPRSGIIMRIFVANRFLPYRFKLSLFSDVNKFKIFLKSLINVNIKVDKNV